MRRYLLLAALPLAALLAPAAVRAQTAAAPAPTPRDALLRADFDASEAMARRGLADGLAAALAGDAVYLHPGAPVIRGREAVRALLAAQPAAAATALRWTPLHAEVSADGTAGVTLGVAAWAVARPDSAPSARFGHYLSFWRRRAGGPWELAAHVQTGVGRGTPVLPAGWSAAFQPDTGRGGARALAERADRDFAAMGLARGAGPAFTAFAAPDALGFGRAGEIVRGPEALGAPLDDGGRSKWVWGPVFSLASDDGTLAVTVGEATIDSPGPDGGRNTLHSKYLTVWKRQPDGRFRYLADSGNARPAPGAAVAARP